MLNFALQREIYGMNPWFVDQLSLPGLLSILNNTGKVQMELPEIKYNTPSIFKLNQETRIIERPFGNYWDKGQLENNDVFEGIGIIHVNGPITRNGGMSSMGTEQIANIMMAMAADERIKAFIFVVDSGGGSSFAVQILVDAMTAVKAMGITIYGIVPKGGMAASAAYGIISACDKVFSDGEMNIFGSAGTMCQFEGRAANSEDPKGTKYVRLYATKSTEKNKGFEEALNNDNYKVIIDELLDPMNEMFLAMIVSNRPALAGTDFDNGHTEFAKDCIGTFIDGIASFNEVVEMLEGTFENGLIENQNNNNNLNSQKMTRAELQAQHPELFQEVFNLGAASEGIRVGAWMAHYETDPEAVQAGIDSGKEISAKDTQQLLVKASQKSIAAKLESENAPDLTAGEAGKEGNQPTEAENFYAQVKKDVK
ncbi:MAG: hypothetical protein V4547_16325 [Bacteroidota bacterium]